MATPIHPWIDSPPLERAAVRWQTAAVIYSGDLLSDVRTVSRTAQVFGVRSTEDSLRSVAERALEHPNAETRELASQLLAELNRIPKFRRAGR